MGQVRNGQYVGVHHGDVGRWRTHGGQEMEDTGGGGGGGAGFITDEGSSKANAQGLLTHLQFLHTIR